MNTPRTDEAILTEPYQIKELPFEVVKASKMAELETELQTMTTMAEKLAEALQLGLIIQRPGDIWSVDPSKIQQFFTGAKQALAAYENHKKGNTP